MLFYTPHSSPAFTRSVALNLVRPYSNRATRILLIFLAAYFVQSTVASYERYFAEMNTSNPASGEAAENDGKECSNLLVLISELYNFQVVSSVLVFDIIRALLAEDLTEFKVELLLKLVRSKCTQ